MSGLWNHESRKRVRVQHVCVPDDRASCGARRAGAPSSNHRSASRSAGTPAGTRTSAPPRPGDAGSDTSARLHARPPTWAAGNGTADRPNRAGTVTGARRSASAGLPGQPAGSGSRTASRLPGQPAGAAAGPPDPGRRTYPPGMAPPQQGGLTTPPGMPPQQGRATAPPHQPGMPAHPPQGMPPGTRPPGAAGPGMPAGTGQVPRPRCRNGVRL